MRVPPPSEPKANQVVRLPQAVRRQVQTLAQHYGIRPASLYRAYIEAGVRGDMRRLRGVLDVGGRADTRTEQETN